MMSALSAGMGAGALIPSIISLVMNPGNSHQLFSVATFYWMATAVVVLDYSGIFPIPTINDKADKADNHDSHDSYDTAATPLLPKDASSHSVNTLDSGSTTLPVPNGSRSRLWLHMAVVCWGASLIFGWQPGLVPYLMPNGHPLVVFQIAGQVRERVKTQEIDHAVTGRKSWPYFTGCGCGWTTCGPFIVVGW
jgi:hypothetical protein